MSHSAKLCVLEILFYRIQSRGNKLDSEIRNAETNVSF